MPPVCGSVSSLPHRSARSTSAAARCGSSARAARSGSGCSAGRPGGRSTPICDAGRPILLARRATAPAEIRRPLPQPGAAGRSASAGSATGSTGSGARPACRSACRRTRSATVRHPPARRRRRPARRPGAPRSREPGHDPGLHACLHGTRLRSAYRDAHPRARSPTPIVVTLRSLAGASRAGRHPARSSPRGSLGWVRLVVISHGVRRVERARRLLRRVPDPRPHLPVGRRRRPVLGAHPGPCRAARDRRARHVPGASCRPSPT